jgi:hypothetical protein
MHRTPETRRRIGFFGLLVLLLLALPGTLRAQFYYTIENGTVTITGYNHQGWIGPLNIPSTYVGLPVTAIGNSAFSWVSLETWRNAFIVTSVSIPDSVRSIGDHAFFLSPYLTDVSFGNGLTNIGHLAFGECPTLASFTAGPSNPAYVTWDGILFNQDLTTLVLYPGGKVGSYAIPESVTNIGNEAFSYCRQLPDVTIPVSVTRVGNAAFQFCSGLSSITLGSGVTTIGQWAFAECTNLTSITLDNGLTNIGQFAFSGCSRLTTLTIPSSVTTLVDWVFAGCSGLTSVSIPNSVTSIGYSAFEYCGSLTNITIPARVTTLGTKAFHFCSSLTEINVDALNSAFSSVDGVLFDKSQTTLIQFPEGRPGNYSIPTGVTVIGHNAFEECTSLTSVTVPSTVTNIGDSAFYDCLSLRSIAIPDGVTSIGNVAFVFCTNLTTVTIPDTVDTIGYAAFQFCTSLTNVIIGSRVNNIGFGTFWCPNLTGLYFRGNAPTLAGSPVLTSATNPVVYYLPGTTGWGPTFGGRPTALWILPPPTISCPAPLVLECANGAAQGVLELGLTDSSGNPVVVVWTVDGTPYQTNTVPSGGVLTSTNLTFAADFGLGKHLVTVSASNGQTATVTCSTTVEVRDTTPPQILSLSAMPNLLWPPNHRMVPVSIEVQATDNCGPTTNKIVAVTCNEPGGSLKQSSDWLITGDLSLDLRAERLGKGSGRIYTIWIECVDLDGNSSSASVTVAVQHDSRTAILVR